MKIHGDQPERAIMFYRELLGWEFTRAGPMDYWLISTGPRTSPGVEVGPLVVTGE